MNAKRKIEDCCSEAKRFAQLQEWAAARMELAKAAQYLLPLQLEYSNDSNNDHLVDGWGELQGTTEYVAERYCAAFPSGPIDPRD